MSPPFPVRGGLLSLRQRSNSAHRFPPSILLGAVSPSTLPFEALKAMSTTEWLRTVSLSNGLSNGSGSTRSMPRAPVLLSPAWGGAEGGCYGVAEGLTFLGVRQYNGTERQSIR